MEGWCFYVIFFITINQENQIPPLLLPPPRPPEAIGERLEERDFDTAYEAGYNLAHHRYGKQKPRSF